jgi:photosystem II stability/assembly factor-like uncharacterized protein
MRWIVLATLAVVACKSSSEEKPAPSAPPKATEPPPAPPPSAPAGPLELSIASLEALPSTADATPIGRWKRIQKQVVDPATSSGVEFREVVLAGERGWALTRSEGTTYGTTDGGARWQRLDQHLSAITFGDERSGWAIGGVDTLKRTRDGGATWEDVGTASDARTIHAPDAETVCIVHRESYGCTKDGKERSRAFHDHGYLYFARGGWLFGKQSAGPQANKLTIWRSAGDGWERAVVFTDASAEPGSVSIVGETIWMTYNDVGLVSNDAGKTWRKVVGVPLLYVHFADADHGWAIGADRALLGTVDGGATWAPQKLTSKRETVRWIGEAGGRTWLAGDGGLYRFEPGQAER